MAWHGMAWYGMVCYGVAWYGIVWYGMVQHGMVWCGMVWYSMAWYGNISSYQALFGSVMVGLAPRFKSCSTISSDPRPAHTINDVAFVSE